MFLLKHLSSISLCFSFFLLSACTPKPDDIDVQLKQLSKHYPVQLKLPEDGIKSTAIKNLGMKLFFSKSLSGNDDVACASCHHPLLAGADQLSLAIGESPINANVLGKSRQYNWQHSEDPNASPLPNIPRNSPTTFNTVFYKQAMFWDGRVFIDASNASYSTKAVQKSPDSRLGQADIDAGKTLLETQTRFPVTSNQEMLGFSFAQSLNNNQIRLALVNKLKSIQDDSGLYIWQQLFHKAFKLEGQPSPDSITIERLQQAIAAYQSAQIFIDTPWQAYIEGNTAALSLEQKKGAILFFNGIENGGAGCVGCHQPPFFTDELFHNLAAPQFGRGKNANGEDFGRFLVTRKQEDKYKFRTPSLLNVSETSPYFHNGSFLSLNETIQHHLDPIYSLKHYDFSFTNNPQLNPIQKWLTPGKHLSNDVIYFYKKYSNSQPITLSKNQIASLTAFLQALTDPCLKNTDCLDKFIPPAKDAPPNQLQAIFKAPILDDITPPTLSSNHEKTKPIRIIKPAKFITYCELQSNPEQHKQKAFFTEVSAAANLQSQHQISPEIFNFATLQRLLFTGGAAAADINNDCLPDIYHSTGDKSVDALYINQGQLNFINKAAAWGINQIELSNGATFSDIDGDKDLDLLTSNVFHPTLPPISGTGQQTNIINNTVYENIDNKQFKLSKTFSISASNTIWSFALADIDADTDLDLLTTHWQFPNPTTNHLWVNENNAFTPADKTHLSHNIIGTSDTTWTGTFSDINNDSYPDILMASDFEQSQVYINNTQGHFLKTTQSHQLTDQNAMGSITLDYDNDGDLDWFVTSVYDPTQSTKRIHNWDISGNRLYQNNDGIFTDVTEESGLREGYWGWGACAADFNNDGLQDIFMTNGFNIPDSIAKTFLTHELDTNNATTKAIAQKSDLADLFKELMQDISRFSHNPNQLFMANHQGGFSDKAIDFGITEPSEGRAVICSDFDRDGDIDILVSNNFGTLQLFRNNHGSQQNFINISLQGLGKNTQAIGAKVYLKTGNKTQLQEVKAGGNFISSAPAELHFGVQQATSIDEIIIEWPKPSPFTSIIKDLKANQFIQINIPKQTQ